jgi:hypothetical protein
MILLGLFLMIAGNCERADSKTTEMDITLGNAETYRLTLGFFGDEEGPSIVEDAQHAKSSIILGEPWEIRIYEYIPDSGYVGSDKVVIRTARGSDGASPNDNIEFFKINFNITQ